MSDTTSNTFSNTALDDLSREVPEAAVGPELTPEEQKAKRLRIAQRAITKLNEIDQTLWMIERALGPVLPDVLREQSLGDMTDIFADLKLAMDRIGGDGGAVAAVKKRIDYCREVVIPERLKDEDVKSFNTERFRVTRTSRIFASMNPEAGVVPDGDTNHPDLIGLPKGFLWLRENGHESLLKLTVNASSLSSAAKELMEGGMELPEEFFRVHTKDNTSVTKK